jgi:protein-disulfide isomerase
MKGTTIMNGRLLFFGNRIVFILLPLLLFMSFISTKSGAQQEPSKNTVSDEQKLIEKVKAEVMKELREGDFLREQIQLGIQEHIKKQKEAQAAAQAEQLRAATEKIKNVRRVSARDHVHGNPKAPVSLIEYSDFECPFCKRFHVTAKEIVKSHNDKVNWVYRHFPLNFHNPGAQKQAEASECANELGGNDAFWKYADAIYERTQSNGKGFPLTQIVPLAKEIGLDEKKFAQCFESGKYEARVKEDLDEGGKIGINGTPANILIHNETGEVVFKSGALPLEAFKSDIEKLLSKDGAKEQKASSK